ncbi:unnamed protein product [Clonostachys rosea f. rosea IK726]|uniref:Rhodopsin domain-containing protein n=2 Tax=Bionectria ochroleuca TaxID=29856 RepID=A0A0B7KNQ3_BIOOC|nr:unnamed protein product [Clonostachys rosea f. rosea IK726]
MSETQTSAVDPARAAESRVAQIVGVTTVFHVLALIIVILRSYTRLFLVRSFAFPDAFMILSVLCALLGGTVTIIMQVPYGLGRHQDTVPPADLIPFTQLSFIQSIVPLMGGIAFLKIAIALELMKLKGNALAWYNTVLWCLIGFVVAYTLMAWFSFFLFCRPMAKYWDPSIEGSCYSVSLFVKFGLINTAFNIFTDVAFATLPIPIVWLLKMPLKTRLYLVGVLSLGYVAVIMGILKAVAQIDYNPLGDGTFTYDVQFWGLLQLNLGIIAACGPSLKPLVRNILQLTSLTPRYGYTGSGGYNNQRSGRATGLYTIGGTGSKGYTKQNSRTDGTEFELRSQYRATASARDAASSPGPYETQKGNGSPERTGSQETILHEEGGKKAIVRTTEVTITY